MRELSAKAVAEPGEGGIETTGGIWSRWKQRTTQGAPFYPLAVLFGLNTVDELDRTAFGVLLPEIRDHFGLDNSGILTVVVAVAHRRADPRAADRLLRRPRAPGARSPRAGAAVWGVFSLLTAAAGSVFDVGAARAGAGHRAGGQRPHPQLAAGRLLRHPRPAPGVRGPPLRQRARRSSSARWPAV